MAARSRPMTLLFLAATLHLASMRLIIAGETDGANFPGHFSAQGPSDKLRLSWRIAQAKMDERKMAFYMSATRQRRVREGRASIRRNAPEKGSRLISVPPPPSGR